MRNLEITAKMKKWLEEQIKKDEQINLEKKDILSNTKYIDWLENFTKEHKEFTDDEWTYCPEKLSISDLEKVNKLHLLYDGIDEYASKNYLYPTVVDFGAVHKIKLNNTGFEIGVFTGQGSLFFCRRIKISKNNKQNFIDFNDIINNKKQDGVDEIDKKLNKLSNLIEDLDKSGIPHDAIKNTFIATLNKPKYNKVKTLKKI
jgi:hypothetical protein